MNVQYVFGPNAGTTAHVPRDQFIDILIKAGVLELVEEPAPQIAPQPVARFLVAQQPVSGTWFVKATDGRTTLFFTGKPETLPEYKFYLAGKCNYAPEEIQREYYARYNTEPTASSRPSEVEVAALIDKGQKF